MSCYADVMSPKSAKPMAVTVIRALFICAQCICIIYIQRIKNPRFVAPRGLPNPNTTGIELKIPIQRNADLFIILRHAGDLMLPHPRLTDRNNHLA